VPKVGSRAERRVLVTMVKMTGAVFDDLTCRWAVLMRSPLAVLRL